MTTIYLIRHGETEWNKKRIMQGSMDSPLTDLGIKQAEQLGERFKNTPAAAIYSSDLPRARNTALVIAKKLGLEVVSTKDLRERRFGGLEGRPIKDYETELARLGREECFNKYNIETDEDLMKRFMRCLNEITGKYKGKTALIVSHGSVMRRLLVHLGLKKEEEVPIGSFTAGSVIKLIFDSDKFFLE